MNKFALLSSFVIFAVIISSIGCYSTYRRSSATKDSEEYVSLANQTAPTADVLVEQGVNAPKDISAAGNRYAEIEENPFLEVGRAPLSTFSIDVDTASYANIRSIIEGGGLPPKDAVRIEELINYFEYDYPQPIGDLPFAVKTEVASAPWAPGHKILQIGLQGKNIALDNLPPSNLVFLLDVSGSMQASNKLPLLVASLKTMLGSLNPQDRVAIVTYAGNSGIVLPSTPVAQSAKIIAALDDLEAGGGTAGGEGIRAAYGVAESNLIKNGNNRVILATDGDFNVGESSDEALVSLIAQKRKSDIFLSVLGFGNGNLNDSMMEKISNAGNGNYAYIDSLSEARKALGSQIAGTLFTIAKDVKIQVEFNPAKVAGYRLIGYENRLLADKDFNDDRKDAGEIGAGISVTALYEIVPAGEKVENPGGISLKYSGTNQSGTKFLDELATVKLRYKTPRGDKSRMLSIGVLNTNTDIRLASADLKFVAALAQYGMLLRNSAYKGSASYEKVSELAVAGRGSDLKNYRRDFAELVRKTAAIQGVE
ncbi:MAG: vWA domain-containing protein [Pyrinomonadaceae bacterium]